MTSPILTHSIVVLYVDLTYIPTNHLLTYLLTYLLIDMKKGSFVSKVLQILNEPSWTHLVHWRPDGQSFVVINPEEFSKNILPRYFKHSKFSSFIRQLHLYGFRKSSNIHSMAVEFTNPNFIRGREDLLVNVKRRAPKPNAPSMTTTNIIPQPTVGIDNSVVESLRSQLDDLKEQNRALSEDNHNLRLKVDAFYNQNGNQQSNTILDEFFEAGYQFDDSALELPPLVSPTFSSSPEQDVRFDFPQLTRHPSFDKIEMNHSDDMNIDYPEPFMNFQDYGMYMEAGEMFYPMQEDSVQPNDFFAFGY